MILIFSFRIIWKLLTLWGQEVGRGSVRTIPRIILRVYGLVGTILLLYSFSVFYRHYIVFLHAP